MGLIPQADEEYLKEKGFNYEIKQVDSAIHTILKGWKFPAAYEPRTADILVVLLPGYPLSPMDMFWTSPDVKLVGGAWPLNADVPQQMDGQNWQRWSRHYEWRAGVDNLRTFITAITTEINLGR